MNSADLKERIKIYSLCTTATVYGDTHDEYMYNYTCRARVNYASGNRTVENDAIFYAVDREFIVRSYVPVHDTDIIVWNDEQWRILSIDRSKALNDIIIRTTKIEGDNIIFVED